MVFKLILTILLLGILIVGVLNLWYPFGFEGVHWP